MDYNRKKTREIKVGSIGIGGNNPITIQSMTNTDTHNIEKTYSQVLALERAGCEIVRLTAPDIQSVATFAALKERGIKIPLVADVHFNHKIAVEAAYGGADKIRINPGNIGGEENVRAVADACRKNGVPIRIGVNSGSVEKSLIEKYGAPTPEALVESALSHIRMLEAVDFYDIAVSVKASSVKNMILANRLLSERIDYPIHLGVTEAGEGEDAIIKSSIGVGSLLSEGIGDTLRVSLTDDPVKEVSAALGILSALGIRDRGMDIVGCPTCGRTKIDLIALMREFKARVKSEGLDTKKIKVAIMGCAVNGPGEAREADIGIAGGDGEGLIFSRGEIIAKVKEERLLDALIDEIKKMK